MPKSPRILVLNDHGPSYFRPFDHLGYEYEDDPKLIHEPGRIALLVLTGGADVTPSLYNAAAHPSTFNRLKRDQEEVAVARAAIEAGIPIAGICRGSQLACVLAGGKLVQDVTGHVNGDHEIVAEYPDAIKRTVVVTSSHHQMQHPFNLSLRDYRILAAPKNPLSSHYIFGPGDKLTSSNADALTKIEPDVVWYPRIKALAAQYHPEWMSNDSEGMNYFRLLVDHYLLPLMEENDIQRGKIINS